MTTDQERVSEDPAEVAAARPEPEELSQNVHAIGIGPGNADFLTPRGRQLLEEADIVVGFETVVSFIEHTTDADLLTCGYDDEAATLETFAERVANGERGVAVLMGDPNHSGYQFLGKVEKALGTQVRLVPGISSLQIAASRVRTPMEETTFVTLHKSGDLTADLNRLQADVGTRNLLVLPRPFDLMPGDIAAHLLKAGAPQTLEAVVLERLTHEDEAQTRTNLESLATHAGGGRDGTPFSDLSVLAVRR